MFFFVSNLSSPISKGVFTYVERVRGGGRVYLDGSFIASGIALGIGQ